MRTNTINFRKGFRVSVVAAVVAFMVSAAVPAAEGCDGVCQETSASDSGGVQQASEGPARAGAGSAASTQNGGEDPDVDEVDPDPVISNPGWIGGLVGRLLGLWGVS